MDEFKICTCKYCGKDIKVYPRPDGKGFKERQVCDECAKPQYKMVKCKKCGKEFKVYRNLNGRGFQRKTVCDDCLAPVKSKTFICEKCGKTFTVTRNESTKQFTNRKLCDNCLKPDEYKINICEKCGKEFKVYRSKDSKQNQFLNRKLCDDCSKPVDFIIKQCEKCGKEFKVYRSEAGYISYNRRYCDDCLKPEIITKICIICGKEFETLKSESWRKTCSNPKCIAEAHNNSIRQTCQEKYGVDYPCLLPQVANSNKLMHSKINQTFGNLLRENNIIYEDDYRVGNYVYDFYIVKTSLFIEINPTISHTSTETGVFDARDKHYHIDKMKYANEHGYNVINIWQWDDWDRIINMLKPKEKLYARKLELKEIDKQTANEFLDLYHIQNSCYGNEINLGLYYNNQPVQVMTFGKPRYNKNYQYELLRLCSHPNYIIVGGTERLFKHFINTYQPKSVISYCDVSKFTGNVYKRLGFKQVTKPQPREHWSKNKQHVTAALLNQKGYDKLFNANYGKGTDNRKLMLKNGWLPVWDCGQVNFIWSNLTD